MPLIDNSSVMDDLKQKKETLWLNESLTHTEPYDKINGFGFVHMQAAQKRLMRFLPYIARVFPETAPKKGLIESSLIEIPRMRDYLRKNGSALSGRLFLKDDAHLPIAGSVKARGGIYEVLKIAEDLARDKGILRPDEDHALLDSDDCRAFFGQYTIQVGSTGNLGLSIGRMASRMGFRTIVHMSSDAKTWKKDLLRSEGVIVREYEGDYTSAVENGRALSEADPTSFFIDDEHSKDLFFGYSTAPLRLKIQLHKAGVSVDADHPLFVYLPCGVGGAPGGITFGLKELYGDHVHCFFAEPLEAPCFTLGMASGLDDGISVYDIGLTGRTLADGLAVGRVSGFVASMMTTIVSGSYTLSDDRLPIWQKAVKETEDIRLEPSACAGFLGPLSIEDPGNAWEAYLEAHGLKDRMANATHVVWATGGGLMPEE